MILPSDLVVVVLDELIHDELEIEVLDCTAMMVVKLL